MTKNDRDELSDRRPADEPAPVSGAAAERGPPSSPAESEPSTLEPQMTVRSIDPGSVAKMRDALSNEQESDESVITALRTAARESAAAWEEQGPDSNADVPKPMAGAAPRLVRKRASTLYGIAPPPETSDGPASQQPDDLEASEAPRSAPTSEVTLPPRDTIAETTEKRKPLLLKTPEDLPQIPGRIPGPGVVHDVTVPLAAPPVAEPPSGPASASVSGPASGPGSGPRLSRIPVPASVRNAVPIEQNPAPSSAHGPVSAPKPPSVSDVAIARTVSGPGLTGSSADLGGAPRARLSRGAAIALSVSGAVLVLGAIVSAIVIWQGRGRAPETTAANAPATSAEAPAAPVPAGANPSAADPGSPPGTQAADAGTSSRPSRSRKHPGAHPSATPPKGSGSKPGPGTAPKGPVPKPVP